MDSKVYFGCTRFSLYSPNSSSWQASKMSEDEYLNYLFDEKRLLTRLKIFNEYSLPILEKASLNIKLLHVIQYSPLLPEKIKLQLSEISRRYKFIYLELIDLYENPHLKFLEFIQKSMFDGSPLIFGYYYLDDDDLLSVNYFGDTSKYLNEIFVGYHVSFGLGVTAYFSEDKYDLFKLAYYPKLNIGILRVCKYDGKKITYPLTGNHTLIDRQSPIILDSTNVMWLWTRHESQDTGLNNSNLSVISSMERFQNFDKPLEIQNKFLFKPQVHNYIKFYDYDGKLINRKTGLNIKTSRFLGKSCRFRVYFEEKTDESGDKFGIIYTRGKVNQTGFYPSSNPDIGTYRYVKKNCDYLEFFIENICLDNYYLKLWQVENSFGLNVAKISYIEF